MGKSKSFTFDGGAATYWGTAVLGRVLTIVSLGLLYPFALVMRLRWRAKHTYIDGRQLVFLGTAFGLIGNWIKWWFLTLITLGIYGFWVTPRLNKWIVENTDFASRSASSNGARYRSGSLAPHAWSPTTVPDAWPEKLT